MEILKPHPIMITNYLVRYLLLLIIPTIRGIINFLMTGNITTTIIWYIIFLGIIVFISLLKLRRCRLYINSERIKTSQGLFYRRELVIKNDKISSLFTYTGVVLQIFRAVSVRIETEAGDPKKADFEIIISQKDLSKLIPYIYEKPESAVSFHAGPWRVCIMALSASYAITGTLLTLSVINYISKIIEDDIALRLYEGLKNTAALFDFLLPRAIGVLAAAAALGFIFFFVYTIARYARFTVMREYTAKGEVISIGTGFISRRKVKFSERSVNALFVNIRPFMAVLGHYNVRICLAGYGKSKKEEPVLIPSERRDKMPQLIKSLLPDMDYVSPDICPPKWAAHRFVLPQVIMLLLSPLAARVISIFTVNYENEMFLSIVICMFIIAVWLVMRNRAAHNSGIHFGSTLCFRTVKRMTDIKAVVAPDKVSVIKISRSPFDIPFGLCSVYICVHSERAKQYKIRHLLYSQVSESVKETLINKF